MACFNLHKIKNLAVSIRKTARFRVIVLYQRYRLFIVFFRLNKIDENQNNGYEKAERIRHAIPLL